MYFGALFNQSIITKCQKYIQKIDWMNNRMRFTAKGPNVKDERALKYWLTAKELIKRLK